MRGTFPKAGVMGLLALSMVGCSSPAPIPSSPEAPPSSAAVSEIPRLTLPDEIAPGEMVKGENEAFETQQRYRRPWVRWRRAYRRGVPYYVPYYYYYWYPRPYYRPYYRGDDWYYYSRPGFGGPRMRFRRDRDYGDRDYGDRDYGDRD